LEFIIVNCFVLKYVWKLVIEHTRRMSFPDLYIVKNNNTYRIYKRKVTHKLPQHTYPQIWFSQFCLQTIFIMQLVFRMNNFQICKPLVFARKTIRLLWKLYGGGGVLGVIYHILTWLQLKILRYWDKLTVKIFSSYFLFICHNNKIQ